jgi:DNA-binding XRE family transcriptional regulator
MLKKVGAKMARTLKEYRVQLGWNVSTLASKANVSRQAVNNAERGTAIQAETAKALADALSAGYGQKISVLDIQGLSII